MVQRQVHVPRPPQLWTTFRVLPEGREHPLALGHRRDCGQSRRREKKDFSSPAPAPGTVPPESTLLGREVKQVYGTSLPPAPSGWVTNPLRRAMLPQPGCCTHHFGTAPSVTPLCCAGSRAITVHGASRTPKGIHFIPPKMETSCTWPRVGLDAWAMGRGRGSMCDGRAVSRRATSWGQRRAISTEQQRVGASPNTHAASHLLRRWAPRVRGKSFMGGKPAQLGWVGWPLETPSSQHT